MIEGLKSEGPFDGVLSLRPWRDGVRGVLRPKPSWPRGAQAVGPKACIAATFDLHGNEDDEFLKHADMGFAVKYFPHYDEYCRASAPRACWCVRSADYSRRMSR